MTMYIVREWNDSALYSSDGACLTNDKLCQYSVQCIHPLYDIVADDVHLQFIMDRNALNCINHWSVGFCWVYAEKENKNDGKCTLGVVLVFVYNQEK